MVQNAPHFRQLAVQISPCIAVFTMSKSWYTKFGLVMNEQKIVIQKFQANRNLNYIVLLGRPQAAQTSAISNTRADTLAQADALARGPSRRTRIT